MNRFSPEIIPTALASSTPLLCFCLLCWRSDVIRGEKRQVNDMTERYVDFGVELVDISFYELKPALWVEA